MLLMRIDFGKRGKKHVLYYHNKPENILSGTCVRKN